MHIYDFMLELKSSFYPNVNMILYEDFSQYVGRDNEFCIDARMYYKYSKLLVPGYEFDLKTCDKKSDIKDVLKSSNMKNDTNFNLRIEPEVRENRGSVDTKIYMMNPRSNILRVLDGSYMKKDINYRLLIEEEQDKNPKHGGNNANIYMNHPRSNILRVLDGSYMKKDINYRLSIDGEPVAQGGFVKSNRYMMNPESFCIFFIYFSYKPSMSKIDVLFI